MPRAIIEEDDKLWIWTVYQDNVPLSAEMWHRSRPVTTEFLERYRRVTAEYNQMQKELFELYDSEPDPQELHPLRQMPFTELGEWIEEEFKR